MKTGSFGMVMQLAIRTQMYNGWFIRRFCNIVGHLLRHFFTVFMYRKRRILPFIYQILKLYSVGMPRNCDGGK